MAGPVTCCWLFCWCLYEHFPKPRCRGVLLHVSLSPRPVRVLITATAYVEVINLAEQDSITGKWKQTTGMWQFDNPRQARRIPQVHSFFFSFSFFQSKLEFCLPRLFEGMVHPVLPGFIHRHVVPDWQNCNNLKCNFVL